jgi:hypothetical protein
MTETVSQTTSGFADLVAFLTSKNSSRISELNTWIATRQREYGAEVFDPLLEKYKAFSHSFLFQIHPEDIRDNLAEISKHREEHALGTVRWNNAFKPIADASGPPPLCFAFHILLEHYRHIPCWTQFFDFVEKNPMFFHDFFFKTVGYDRADPRYDMRIMSGDMGALRWRLGNAYYSFVKETYLLASLRHTYGIDARYHFLIDVEWKADIYAGDVLLELYIGNKAYKADNFSGRKVRCRDKNKGCKVLQLESDIEEIFGKVWLPRKVDVLNIATKAIAAGAPRLPGWENQSIAA